MSTPAATGFRLTRHLRAFYDGYARCGQDLPISIQLSTGLKTEYCLHTQVGHSQDSAIDPVRLILIMGINSPKEAWGMFVGPMLQQWQAKAFEATLQVLVFDNRGSGAADAPFGRYTTSQMARDTLALMDAVHWSQAHVLGISMGGMIALELAAQAPHRVDSLTLGCTSRGGFSMPMRGKLNFAKMASVSCSQPRLIDCVLDMNFPSECLERCMDDSPRTVRETLRPFYTDMLLGHFGSIRVSMSGALGQAMAIETHFVSDERLERIAMSDFPILIIGGRKDTTIPVHEVEILREHLPGDHVKLMVFEDAGHSACIQYVNEVVEELLRILTKQFA